jgi:hypothetical protein
MPRAFEKTDAYIAPVRNDLDQDPPPAVGDIDSGMQRSTCNGVIGVLAETAGVSAPGATIGEATAADYHLSR